MKTIITLIAVIALALAGCKHNDQLRKAEKDELFKAKYPQNYK